MTDEFQLQNIERLVARVRGITDPDARRAALDLLQSVMGLHASAIDRIMEIASESGDSGWAIIDELGRDPLVSSLLILHGLHPLDLEARVAQALEQVRPTLLSHGGNVELLGVSGNAVRLKLTGACNGCPSSSLTLKTAIEKSIYSAAPDVTSIECEGDEHGASSTVASSAA
jgi:Fe-S cluster biogenesis protein NfuA